MGIHNNAASKTEQITDRRKLSTEERELLIDFDRNVNTLKSSYNLVFTNAAVIIAGKYEVNIQSLLDMNTQTVFGFKSTLEAIAMSGSRSPSTLQHYVQRISRAARDSAIFDFSPDSCSLFAGASSPESLNALRSILNIWYRLGYPGISLQTIDIMNVLRRATPKARKRITSEDPTEGWYTTQEYDDLIDSYWADYESGKVNLRDTTALLLVGQFGKRGSQLADLKVCDFQSEGTTDGLAGKRVAFPGAKDRSPEEWFRGSKFEVHPIGDDLWNLCMLQKNNSIEQYKKILGEDLTEIECAELPFLHKTHGKQKLLACFKREGVTPYFHHSTSSISTILTRQKGTEVLSHRTGTPVREFAYRMRYTRARQLARLGVPRTTLQYWLGHGDGSSLDHYYDDPAEDARLLDLEMQLILAPLAQAFSGSLRDKESDAIRGDDPTSRIEIDGRDSVGTCGEHGFCSASVPIPCYRCSKFQPWVDAPHEEVLLRLIERQEEENNIHLSSKGRRILVPLQLDKDIAAVKLVIKLCDDRRRKINSDAYKIKQRAQKNHFGRDVTTKSKASE